MHMICGKIASGKSTLSAELGRAPRTVVLSEDDWLFALFGDRMRTLADYVECAARLREVAGPLCTDLLKAGNAVVMDFAANRPQDRAWMRGLAEAAGVPAQLHYLEACDEFCLERLKRRNARGQHPFKVSEAQFHQVTAHFVPPAPDEGLEIRRY